MELKVKLFFILSVLGVIQYTSIMTGTAKKESLSGVIEYPNHSQQSQRTKCNTVLLKQVKCGGSTKLLPWKVYAYNSLVTSLTKLCNQPNFLEKCEHWRDKVDTSGTLFTDVYDGKVWRTFQVLDGRPFLKIPNNLCLKLSLVHLIIYNIVLECSILSLKTFQGQNVTNWRI